MRRSLALAVAALGLFAVVTLVALEGREVALLRTTGTDSGPRETRVWVVDTDGTTLVEAANPERPFLRDLRTHPQVTLVRHGRAEQCAAAVLPDPEGHAHIRRLLRAKYGWRDRWIALLADTRDSSAVELRCE